jgi:hypothetical protein
MAVRKSFSGCWRPFVKVASLPTRGRSANERWRVHDWRGDGLLVHGESAPGFLFGEILLFAAYVAYSVVRAARWPGID